MLTDRIDTAGRAPRLRGADRRMFAPALVVLVLGCASSPHAQDGRRSALRDEPIAPVVELRASVREGDAPAVVLALENRGGSPAQLDDAHARFDLTQDGEPVRACASAGREWVSLTDGSETLSPGATRRFEVTLPCTLVHDGDYELRVDMVIGAEDPSAPAPAAVHLAASSAMRVVRGHIEPRRMVV